jgi:hypothetical protein
MIPVIQPTGAAQYIAPGVVLSADDAEKVARSDVGGGLLRVAETYGQALWYAWGYRDALPDTRLTLDDGTEFATRHTLALVEYMTGRACWHASILGAWAEYRREVGK